MYSDDDRNRRQYTTNRRVGDRVRLIHHDSIAHRQAGDMSIYGSIVQIDLDHMEGRYYRPFKIHFDDGYLSWWASHEIRRI